MAACRSERRSGGFTLIELMVAIAIMALLALMSWRGLEGMARTTRANQVRGDAVLTLQTALAQWSVDLDAVAALPQTKALEWDGRVLRLTRRASAAATPAMLVVAWTLRPGPDGSFWRRWQSPPLTRFGEWQQAWQLAEAWARDGAGLPADADVALLPLQGWQLATFQNARWTVAPNFGIDSRTVAGQEALPDGLRLVLTLAPGDGLSGVITRDWVRPSYGESKQ
ncbi:MAG: prepilin-type N-terminal cleavage/methylation domain-containing protein [Variovorax sp.]